MATTFKASQDDRAEVGSEHGALRLRRPHHRLRLRRLRLRPAPGREGLPRRRPRGGPAVHRRHPAPDLLAAEGLPVGAEAGPDRDPAHPRAQGRRGARRRRRGRRLARLRQHPLRARQAVLRRPAVARHHRLGRRARALLRPGRPHAGRRPEPDHDACRRGHEGGGRRDGGGAHLPADARSASTSATAPESRGPIPSSAASGPERTGLHRVRRVHDRLPAQRQEHAAQELPRPGRGGGRARLPDDDGHRPGRARGRRLHHRHRPHRHLGKPRGCAP